MARVKIRMLVDLEVPAWADTFRSDPRETVEWVRMSVADLCGRFGEGVHSSVEVITPDRECPPCSQCGAPMEWGVSHTCPKGPPRLPVAGYACRSCDRVFDSLREAGEHLMDGCSPNPKTAPGWLNRKTLFGRLTPLDVVYWVLGGGFVVFLLWIVLTGKAA